MSQSNKRKSAGGAGGVGGFIDSALYTLELGFDMVAWEMAYALGGNGEGGMIQDADAWDNRNDGDDSIAGSSIGEVEQSKRQELSELRRHVRSGGTVVVGKGGTWKLLPPPQQREDYPMGDDITEYGGDDDDTTLDNNDSSERRQGTDDIFRPTPFDPSKVDMHPYVDLIRMGTENYQLGSHSFTKANHTRRRINEIEDELRLRTIPSKRGGMQANSACDSTRFNKNKLSSKGVAIPPKKHTVPVPAVAKASLNLQKASFTLEDVKRKRRALEESHNLLQKQLEMQKLKNMLEHKGGQQRQQRDPPTDGHRDSTESEDDDPNSEDDEYTMKLKTLERRYNEIQNRKADRHKQVGSRDEMNLLKREMERLAVDKIFSGIPEQREQQSSNQDDDRVLGLTNLEEATPAVEQKRLLNEKAYDQLQQMMNDQIQLESMQKLSRKTDPFYRESIPGHEVCITQSSMDDEALKKELDKLMSSDSFFSL